MIKTAAVLPQPPSLCLAYLKPSIPNAAMCYQNLSEKKLLFQFKMQAFRPVFTDLNSLEQTAHGLKFMALPSTKGKQEPPDQEVHFEQTWIDQWKLCG